MDAATKKWNGEMKEAARNLAVRSDKKTPAKVYLGLPGSGCKCVREALKQGTIDADTFVVAVERDPATADLIETQLNGLVKDYHLHRDVVNTLDLKEVLQGRKIDFAFLDLCGSLDMKLAHWMYGLKDVFTTDAVVAYTYSIQGRSNKFLSAVVKDINGLVYYPNYYFDTRSKIEMATKSVKKIVKKQLHRTARFIYDSNNKYRFATIAAAWALMSNNHNVEITRCEEYCDTTPMVMVKFQLSEKKDNLSSRRAWIFLEVVSYGTLYETSRKKEKKAKVNKLAPWQQLGCPVDMPRTEKAWVVIRAKQGQRPEWMKPADWAWHPINPNGNRRKSA